MKSDTIQNPKSSSLGPSWAQVRLGPGPVWAQLRARPSLPWPDLGPARPGSSPAWIQTQARLVPGSGLGPGPIWVWLGPRPGFGPDPAWVRARLGPGFGLGSGACWVRPALRKGLRMLSTSLAHPSQCKAGRSFFSGRELPSATCLAKSGSHFSSGRPDYISF